MSEIPREDLNEPAGTFDPATDGRTAEPIADALPCDPDTKRKKEAASYRASEASRACGRDLEPERNRNNNEENELRDLRTRELIFAANYTKGMPHNGIGEVTAAVDGPIDKKAYEILRDAVNSEDPDDFEAIPLGPNPILTGPSEPTPPPLRRYVDPQAGLAFDLEGPDAPSANGYEVNLLTRPPTLRIRPLANAPRFESPRIAAEVGEVYLMALLRDVPFSKFVAGSTDPRVVDAVRLMKQFSDYRGPLDPATRQITPGVLFRGGNVLSARSDSGNASAHVGELVGPYLSQFKFIGARIDESGVLPPTLTAQRSDTPPSSGFTLRREDGQVPYGTLAINQMQVEVKPGLDFMTSYGEWLRVQQGVEPSEGNVFTGQRRYIYSLRQFAQAVHFDQTYQEGLVAALLVISMFERAERTGQDIFNDGNPYLPTRTSNQMGFGTFGNGHVLALLAEATTRAIKAAWYHKWYNHRWLRPETLGGRIHNVLTRQVDEIRYSINRQVTGLSGPIVGPVETADLGEPADLSGTPPGAEIMRMIAAHNKAQNEANGRPQIGASYLLPQAYPEGSPLHPTYPAGHATQIAAEVTVMKGIFNEDFTITGREDPVLVPNDDGTKLVPFTLNPFLELTLGGELNKLAANVALARSFASVHYRIDYAESMLLGEYVGLGILQEQARSFNNASHFFELTLFSGVKVRILAGGKIVVVSVPTV